MEASLSPVCREKTVPRITLWIKFKTQAWLWWAVNWCLSPGPLLPQPHHAHLWMSLWQWVTYLERTWSFSPLTSCRSRSLEAGKSYSAITIKLSERRNSTIESSWFPAEGVVHTWVYGGTFHPPAQRGCQPPHPSKAKISTNPAFLPTTTTARGLKLIHRGVSCGCVFKALQTPRSTKAHVSARKEGLCGIRRVINNLSVFDLSFTQQ